MAGIPRVTASVAAKLGHYVYVYVDLLDRRIFYVGKGKGGLALAHLTGRGSPEVAGGSARSVRLAAIPRSRSSRTTSRAETPHFASRRR